MLRRLVPFLAPYIFRMVLSTVLVLASTVGALVSPLLMRSILDTVLPRREVNTLVALIIVMFVLPVASAILRALASLQVATLGQRLASDLREAAFSNLLRQDQQFFDSHPTGELVSYISENVYGVLNIVINSAPDLVTGTVTACLILAVLLYMSPVLAICSVVAYPLVAVLSRATNKRAEFWGGKAIRKMAKIRSWLQESLSLVRVVQAFSVEKQRIDGLKDLHDELVNVWSKVATLDMVVEGWGNQTIQAIAYALVFAAGAAEVLAGHLQVGSIVAALAYVPQLYTAGLTLTRVSKDVAQHRDAFDKLFGFIDLQSEVRDGDVELTTPPPWTVEYDSVSFAYSGDSQDRTSLRDVTLRIEPGHRLAIVGRTGCGKTTMVDLLLRMYPLERGHIRIAGTDIASFTLQSLRSRIAVVDQDPALFDATIQDNILVGRLEATTEEVARVCELAGLTDTIHRFPDGLNTVVGERGARLSGGERQRIALARALIKKAPLLVLDEATAALDSLTEQAVVDHLRDALSDCTVVWVTHRLSIIRFVDTVAVMEEGRIVELGSHRDLIRKNGLYTSFVEAQRLPD